MEESESIYAPFRGIIPLGELAGKVIAAPYDVLDAKEAKAKASGNPLSFLHISKAEIDFEDISPYDERVYARACFNFERLLSEGVLRADEKPCFYVYKMETKDGAAQTGVVVAASVKAYLSGRIKRHELTREAKENDRVKQIRAVGAQTGPALLINRELSSVKGLLKEIVAREEALFEVVGDYEVKHSLWRVSDEKEIALIQGAFAKQNEAYIADGHHRAAAAARLAVEEGAVDDGRFLAVAFFEEEMRILDYNRVVFDLNGQDVSAFLAAVAAKGFAIKEDIRRKPLKKGEFMLYVKHKWYSMVYEGEALGDDPVSVLDVSVLSKKVLDEVLGIYDLRNSERIDFIGGIRGAEEVERVVDLKGGAGFMVYPTKVSELMDVADAGMLMPPKSTWFEPKLADGVVSLATGKKYRRFKAA